MPVASGWSAEDPRLDGSPDPRRVSSGSGVARRRLVAVPGQRLRRRLGRCPASRRQGRRTTGSGGPDSRGDSKPKCLIYFGRCAHRMASEAVQIPNRSLFRQPEVCEIAQVQPYVLRSWEAEFPDLGVSKTGRPAGLPAGGRRAGVADQAPAVRRGADPGGCATAAAGRAGGAGAGRGDARTICWRATRASGSCRCGRRCGSWRRCCRRRRRAARRGVRAGRAGAQGRARAATRRERRSRPPASKI